MDTIIVGIIVAGAVLFIIRGTVRTARGKTSCGGCCSGCSCTSENECRPPGSVPLQK